MGHRRTLTTAAISLVVLSGCTSKPRDSASQAGSIAPQSYTIVDPTSAATIRGTVSFNGKPPAAVEIDMAQDPACQYAAPGPNMSEQFAVSGDRLANVYVYVKAGLEGKNFSPSKLPAVLDQRGCKYSPHVLGMMVNQPLRILNDDPATHNVHPAPRVEGNREWNVSQSPKGDPVEQTFTRPEIMMPVQCNQHPWMKAYINVSKTPFFSVTDASGNFEIRGLPPGQYSIAAVHEKAGEQTQTITVQPKEIKEANFTFSASGR
jgi:Carboxypeptidase regulatory-like domain